MRNKAIACLGAIVACATALAGIPATAMADDSAGLTPQYTYNSQNDNGMTFEKGQPRRSGPEPGRWRGRLHRRRHHRPPIPPA